MSDKIVHAFVIDPRLDPASFERRWMPACDGGPWPPADTAGALERQQIEFLSVYYHINRLTQARLDKTERGDSGNTEVEELFTAIKTRDNLEDRLAPAGFYGEPVMAADYVVDLRFHHALKHVMENDRRFTPLSATVKVSLPAAHEAECSGTEFSMPVEELLADLRRPGVAFSLTLQ